MLVASLLVALKQRRASAASVKNNAMGGIFSKANDIASEQSERAKRKHIHVYIYARRFAPRVALDSLFSKANDITRFYSIRSRYLIMAPHCGHLGAEALGAKNNNVDLLIEEICAELAAKGQVAFEGLGKSDTTPRDQNVEQWLKATRVVVRRKVEFRKGNGSGKIPGEVQSPNFCGGCGRPPSKGEKFCPDCGVKFEVTAKGEVDVFDGINKIDSNKNKEWKWLDRLEWWTNGGFWGLDGSYGLSSILRLEDD